MKKFFKAKRIMALFLVFVMMISIGYKEEYAGATSYTNAKEFYESVSYLKKAETYNGEFYLATMAKLAASSSNLRYHTLGFDITLSGNGASVSFSVALGASMVQVIICQREKNGLILGQEKRMEAEKMYRI